MTELLTLDRLLGMTNAEIRNLSDAEVEAVRQAIEAATWEERDRLPPDAIPLPLRRDKAWRHRVWRRPEPYYSTAQAARFLGVNKQRVWGIYQSGRLPFVRLETEYMVLEDSLLAYESDRRPPGFLPKSQDVAEDGDDGDD